MSPIAEINEATALEYFFRLDALVKPKPKSEESLQVLFNGTNLTVKTGSGADLVASKLYRYSEQDQEDIQFLMLRGGVTLESVRESVSRLPERFRDDVMTVENLVNLERDLVMWGAVR